MGSLNTNTFRCSVDEGDTRQPRQSWMTRVQGKIICEILVFSIVFILLIYLISLGQMYTSITTTVANILAKQFGQGQGQDGQDVQDYVDEEFADKSNKEYVDYNE